MTLVDFSEHLVAAESVVGLATRLGERCLDGSDDLADIRGRPRSEEELDLIEDLAGGVPLVVWEAAIAQPTRFEQLVGGELVAALKRAKTRQPLDFLGVLRGLCDGALADLFESASGQVELVKGLPVPFAERPLDTALQGELTLRQETLSDRGLLYPLPFDLYTHGPAQEGRVVLDFDHAEKLDELTWEKDERLPLIATLHPKGHGELEIERHRRDRFFGVRPAHWNPDAVKALLEQAKSAGARIAVLPELCMPSPDALEAAISDSPDSYPEIIVAGSAHREIPAAKGRRRVRVNESRVYLEGECVLVARKQKPFRFKKLGTSSFRKYQWEDLSGEPKTITILSGRLTRLGVAICADLQEATIPRLLEDAGVNLLLSPSMTLKIGAFGTALSEIAGHRQGVGAIVNTRWDDECEPFLCMCAVPRPHPAQQLCVLPEPGAPPTQIAIFDPNQPLPQAVRWLAENE